MKSASEVLRNVRSAQRQQQGHAVAAENISQHNQRPIANSANVDTTPKLPVLPNLQQPQHESSSLNRHSRRSSSNSSRGSQFGEHSLPGIKTDTPTAQRSPSKSSTSPRHLDRLQEFDQIHDQLDKDAQLVTATLDQLKLIESSPQGGNSAVKTKQSTQHHKWLNQTQINPRKVRASLPIDTTHYDSNPTNGCEFVVNATPIIQDVVKEEQLEDQSALVPETPISATAETTTDNHVGNVADGKEKLAESDQTTFTKEAAIVSSPADSSASVLRRNPSIVSESIASSSARTSRTGQTHNNTISRNRRQSFNSNYDPFTHANQKKHLSEIVPALAHENPEQKSNTARDSAKSSAFKPKLRYISTDLNSIDIPLKLIESYCRLGISQMYRWQAECFQLEDLMSGQRNLVYSAPTGSGKTFVAEVLILKKVLATGKKAIIVEPFVSAVTEKVAWFKRLFKPFRLRVGGYYANSRTRFGFEDCQIAVCTIEKANSSINSMIENNRLKDVGIVVVDELHMVGDISRGYLLELLLTKVKYIRGGGDIQIVGMSATLPNVSLLARWLKAHLYITKTRPVPLNEYVMIKNHVFDKDLKEVRNIHVNVHPKDPDLLVPLCHEVVREGKSVLLFCPSKDSSEKCASNIASLISVSVNSDLVQKRKDLIDKLSKTPGGLDPLLSNTVPVGIAYHHAGLTLEEREIVEGGFREGSLSILCATSTLASGVNLPARRVIIRSLYIGKQMIDIKSYQQMRGRAGRKGDTAGECYLICKHSEREQARRLLNQDMEAISSCLAPSKIGLARSILEVIGSQVAQSDSDIVDYCRSTLFYCETEGKDLSLAVGQAIKLLKDNQLAVQNELDHKWSATQLGQAVFASALSPEEGLHVYRELAKAMKRYVLRGDLYSVYHVTPTYFTIEPDWSAFMRIYCNMDDVSRDCAEVIGISEAFMASAAQGYISRSTEAQREHAMVHKRFYAAMMLQDLIHELPFSSVIEKYNVNRGTLQMLQITASTFSGMVTTFCQRLMWTNLQLLIHQFQDRLCFGIQSELIDLCRMPSMKSSYARVLFDKGYKTVGSIAAATSESIFEILIQSRQKYRTASLDSRSVAAIEAMEKRLSVVLVREAIQAAKQERDMLVKQIKAVADIGDMTSNYNSDEDFDHDGDSIGENPPDTMPTSPI